MAELFYQETKVKPFYKCFPIALITCFALLTSACGGGVIGELPAEQHSLSKNYNGNTSAAEINHANADQIAGDIFTASSAEVKNPLTLLIKVGSKDAEQDKPSEKSAPLVLSFPGTSDCGDDEGSFDRKISLDMEADGYYGLVDFHDYCSLDVSGMENLENGKFIYYASNQTTDDQGDINLVEYKYIDYSKENTDQKFAYDGIVQIKEHSAGTTSVLFSNFNYTDNNGETPLDFLLYQVVLETTENTDNTTTNINGRVYLSELGYVEIVTTSPLTMEKGSTFFSSGTLTIYGGNNSVLYLTAQSDGSFVWNLDNNDDGAIDQSGATVLPVFGI